MTWLQSEKWFTVTYQDEDGTLVLRNDMGFSLDDMWSHYRNTGLNVVSIVLGRHDA